MLHPLTEQIWYSNIWSSKDKLDSVIREYLKDCANRFDGSEGFKTAKQILGLELEKKEEVKVEKWCEHRGIVPDGTGEYYSDHNWKFCPICGTPRPKEIGLREKLVEKFEEVSTHMLWYHDKEGRKSKEQVIPKAQFHYIADIAIQTLKDHLSKRPQSEY